MKERLITATDHLADYPKLYETDKRYGEGVAVLAYLDSMVNDEASRVNILAVVGQRQKSLYIDLCNCLILICSIQHQMKINLWTKNSYRLWLTNWPKTSKPLKTSVSLIGC